jgi:hypothetical protein
MKLVYKNYLIYTFIILIFSVVVFFIYLNYKQNKINRELVVGFTLPVNDDTKPDTMSNPFSFDRAKIGDVVAGMEIIKIQPLIGNDLPSQNNVAIFFKNKKIINGQVNYYETGLLKNKVCLENYDPYEQKNLPRLVGDSRLIFFCFNNTEQAKKIISNKNISIVIDNYVLNAGSSSINVADLVN